MKILKTILETQSYIQTLKERGQSIGFVPTMGALHEGHKTLLRRAKQENDISVCSIFVNPIQFNNAQDLEKYPRTLVSDISKLESVNCDLLFAPEIKEMYPAKVLKKYDFGQLDKVMEGAFRPGHFNGVAVVVRLLFDIISAHKAYFGEKDFQQLAIVKEMVRQEKINIDIIPCKIVREKSGLAMSSRNARLTKKELKVAPIIYETLSAVKQSIHKTPIQEIKQWATDRLNSVKEMKVEYFDIVDTNHLQSLHSINDAEHTIACLAVFLGKVRLIDNILLT